MTPCLFAADLHGDPERYRKLLRVISDDPPAAVFLGGDLLPSGLMPRGGGDPRHADFLNDFLAPELQRVKTKLGSRYPVILAILGNDDARVEEAAVRDLAARGLWTYAHDRRIRLAGRVVYGYAFVPPTPFLLKDWERYDVSRYVDPGCVSTEEGYRSVPVSETETRYATIEEDLNRLVGDNELADDVLLFHTPPYKTALDRAALDGRSIDHVPLDVHVGSIAVRRFIERRQPLVTLHGHVHESARLTGAWQDRIGRTHLFSAAHDGPELALVRFCPEDPEGAVRELL
ncbi:metallophosphoesterase [bacterium]|nr:metallophosphoesterase [bacterium]